MKNFRIFLFNVILLVPAFMFAQHTIKGTVTEASSNSGLPGVGIIIKGSTMGTTTDFDGNYTIEGVKNGDLLEFSYMGFQNQEIKVTEKIITTGSLSIQMAEEANVLNEVILVGFGTARKKDMTGAAVKVSADDLIQGALTDPVQAMQGKAAGVNITKQGGDPNSGYNVRIRGAAGFAAGGDPLYVVNGVRGVDPTTIAPEDITAYDVLKDAASTAIYGADGANGVVFITTKKGTSDRVRLTFSSYLAIDNVANRLDLQSADSYRGYINDNQDKYGDFSDAGGNVNWQDAIFRTGTSQNYNFSMAGGSESSTYRVSFTSLDIEGVIKNSSKNRNIGRLDLTQKLLDDKILISATLGGTLEKNHYVDYGSNGPKSVLFQAFQRLPTDPIYNADGSYFETSRVFNYYNPVALLDQIENERDAKKYLANARVDYDITSYLNANLNLSYLRNDDESTYFEPKYESSIGGINTLIREGYGKRAYNNWGQAMLEATVTYKNTFADYHNLTALVGYSYRNQSWDGFSAQGRSPISNSLGSDNLKNFEDLQLGDVESYKGERTDIGVFARAIYDYASKYYLTAMIRRDGSSVFGDSNQWGWFPSVQVAWNMANEKFFENIEVVNLLKIRASWGTSGNSNIDSYLSTLRVGPSGVGLDPVTEKPITILDYYNNGNSDLKWDNNQEINIGLDFNLFNSRLNGAIEYYTKNLTDMLSIYDVPTETNYANKVFYNGGEIKNDGIEVTLNGDIIKGENFNWNMGYVFSRNNQEVKSLDGGKYNLDFRDVGYISAPGIVGVATQRIMPGYKLGTFFGFDYAGVSEDGKWLVNGADGEIHFLDDVSQSDDQKKVIGNALPEFEMGWSNQFGYKNWDLSLSFRAIYGNDVYNATKQVFGNPDYVTQRNVLNEALLVDGYVGGAYQALSYYIEDGSFIRLDNLNVGYTLPNTLLAKNMKLRLYCSINNVFTLTNYDGIDPEFNFSGGDRGKGEIYFGLDQYNVYPKTRTVTFGLNFDF